VNNCLLPTSNNVTAKKCGLTTTLHSAIVLKFSRLCYCFEVCDQKAMSLTGYFGSLLLVPVGVHFGTLWGQFGTIW
jgi:hypothetical protein